MPRGSGDPNAPSQRAMQFIKNRNNMDEKALKKKLAKVEKERVDTITKVDLDRLQERDFLKQVRHCASDELPESKLWLGEKSKRMATPSTRNIYTAPVGSRRQTKSKVDQKEAEAQKEESQDGLVKFGIFYKKKTELDNNKVHFDIYSRRNMYSSIERDVKSTNPGSDTDAMEDEREGMRADWLAQQQTRQDEEDRKAEELRLQLEREEEERKRKEAEAEARRQAESAQTQAGPLDIRARIRLIAGAREPSDLEKREAKIRMLNSNGALLKDVLVKSARRHAQKRAESAPIEHRLQHFFTKMDDMKQQEEEGKDGELTPEQYERWILMTRGSKAVADMKRETDDQPPDSSTKEISAAEEISSH